MIISATSITGLHILTPKILEDERGSFFKTFHNREFEKFNLPLDWKEEYFSVSNKNVVRGMHFQVPPYDHEKMVCCLRGAVLDVVVDLRKESETYGNVFSLELNEVNKKTLIIPKGCAHGFLSLLDDSLMFYKVSSVYEPEADCGIKWDSIDFKWPVESAVVSLRDQKQPIFSDFNSPF